MLSHHCTAHTHSLEPQLLNLVADLLYYLFPVTRLEKAWTWRNGMDRHRKLNFHSTTAATCLMPDGPRRIEQQDSRGRVEVTGM